MPSTRAYRSLRRLAAAPGARQVIQRLRGEEDRMLLAIGRLESHLLDLRSEPAGRLEDVEFRVFSQFGEDGILQYLLRMAEVSEHTFVEIGTGDYRESNTRFLLENNNWRGAIIDGGQDHVQFVLNSGLSWRYDVEPVSAFVTAENVNDLISGSGFSGPIGVLSIDVDGNDYWIWEAVSVVDPAIVVIEYNALLGPEATVSVPYDPAFVNSRAHYSQLYFGASLAAFVHLGRTRNYTFAGCSSNGANAFFVRDDLAGRLPSTSTAAAYRESRFLTARNPDGSLSRVRSVADRIRLIGDLEVVDVTDGRRVRLADAMGSRGIDGGD